MEENDLEPIFGGPRVVHDLWFNKNKGQYFVMLYGMFTNEHGIETFMNDCIPYAQYVLYKEKKIIVKPWEVIYHINGDLIDDRLENLKVIDTRPLPIEVKYPYDPEKYYATINWHKNNRHYYVSLYLKKEYRNDKSLKKEIQRSLRIYIAETEKLKRFLNDDEKVIFIDNDKLNYNKDNLKIVKGKYSKFPIGEKPFQDYHIGSKYINNKRNGNISISLFHVKDRSKNTNITRSKYRYELKLGRFLKDNERLVYKDGNHLNDDINNLTHIVLEQAEYPFDEYYIRKIYDDVRNGRKNIYLHHKTNKFKPKNMLYSRYKKQVIEGRIFERWEEVDHKDNNPLNDSDDNLQILTKDEHDIKTAQDKKDMTPKVSICCDGCNKEFEITIKENKKN